MLIIGENLNASIKSVAAAIAARDKAFVVNLVKAQDAAGADYIDVNAGAAAADRQQAIADMEWLVDTVQESTEKPLSLDSDDVDVLKAALQRYHRKDCIVNSVTAETTRLKAVTKLALETEGPLVALSMGKGGIPKKAEERLAACEAILAYLEKAGVKVERVLFDPLVLPVAVDSSQAMVTLKTLEGIKSRYPAARTVMGLSNISFGLPDRKLINRSFLLMAAYAGLDTVILNPLDARIMTVAKVADMLAGHDPFCRKYITAFRKGTIVE